MDRYRILIPHGYYVMITTNEAKTVLKTSVTVDISRKLHQLKQEARNKDFLQKKDNTCCYLVYWESIQDAVLALKRERDISKMSAKRRKELITKQNPEWHFLNDTLGIANHQVS